MVTAFLLNVGGLRDRVVGEPGPRIDSIAVLPFENLSDDPGQEYFADGMSEALITNLAKIASLKVISRTSTMQYKKTTKPVPEVARELNVDAVVEGSVLQAEDRVRITAQLIDAATDRHLWAKTYERELGDTITLQSDMALAIAREIQVKAKERQRLVARPELVNSEAYKSYLRGLHAFQNQGAMNCIRFFEDSIGIDSGYAPAHAWLAFLYTWHASSNPKEAAELCRKAKQASRKALELDDTLSEAHSALGWVLDRCDWDWEKAEGEFRRAIELSPSSVQARDCYWKYLNNQGRFDQALDEVQKILELEPLSPLLRRYPVVVYYSARRHSESILALQKLPELRDSSGKPMWRAWPLVFLARNYAAMRSYDEALVTCDKIRKLIPLGADLWTDAAVLQVYAGSNRRGEAQDLLELWAGRADDEVLTRWTSPVCMLH